MNVVLYSLQAAECAIAMNVLYVQNYAVLDTTKTGVNVTVSYVLPNSQNARNVTSTNVQNVNRDII